jgi:hypothetical protein
LTTKKAQKYVSGKIALLQREGVPKRQAVAIAFSMARDKGYSVPPPPMRAERRP